MPRAPGLPTDLVPAGSSTTAAPLTAAGRLPRACVGELVTTVADAPEPV